MQPVSSAAHQCKYKTQKDWQYDLAWFN